MATATTEAPAAAEPEKPRARRMVADKEVQAMLDISNALADLDPATVARVLRWVNSKYEQPSEASEKGAGQ